MNAVLEQVNSFSIMDDVNSSKLCRLADMRCINMAFLSIQHCQYLNSHMEMQDLGSGIRHDTAEFNP